MARDERFVYEEVHGGWQVHCRWCDTSSPVAPSKHRATRWAQRHAMTEFDLNLPEMIAYMRGR